jgi:hypothetical protein
MQTARRSAFRTVEGPVHLDDAAAGQDGTVLGQRGWRSRHYALSSFWPVTSKDPPWNDVPLWATLAGRTTH